MAKGNSKWLSIRLPSDWCVGRYDRMTCYKLGAEAGELEGYRFYCINNMVNTGESTDVTYGKPPVTVSTTCDRVVFNSTATVTLKKTKDDERKMFAHQLEAILRGSLAAKIARSAEETAKAEQEPVETPKNATEAKILPLESIPESVKAMLDGKFDEIYSNYPESEGRVLKAIDDEAYIVTENDDEIVYNDDEVELELDERAKERLARQLLDGRNTVYGSEVEAIADLVGGTGSAYEGLPLADKVKVDAKYVELFRDTPEEYYTALPGKDAFAKEYIREKNWAKYQSYKNDKAYEMNTPYVLRDRKIFVCWKFVYYNEDGEPYMKPQKIPFSPHYDGRALSNSQDGRHKKTWGTFDEACKAVDKYGYDGIGIMFDGTVMGIDLDGVIKDGVLDDAARDIVTRVNSYTEYSPSGTGVHTLCFGTIPKGIRNDRIGLEMYPSGRFFTLTGHRFENYMKMAPREASQPVVNQIYNDNVAQSKNEGGSTPVPTQTTFTSAEIVQKVLSSPKMSGKFKRLCKGLAPFVWDAAAEKWTDKVDANFLKVDGSPDLSKIDFAFAKILVFYRATPAQIDEIYRAQGKKDSPLCVEGGGLTRSKWNRHQGKDGTYGNLVITNAFANVSSVYSQDKARGYARDFAMRKKNTNTDVMD